MHETEYTYGVARIRANENTLLSAADIEQLISASSSDDALRILADKGWQLSEDPMNASKMLESEMEKAWQILNEALPAIAELDALIITNDFHNLKAAIKAIFSHEDPAPYYLDPSVIDSRIVGEAVETKHFALLPLYMQKPAEEAYDVVVRLESGRLADIILDAAALNTKILLAKESGSLLLLEVAQLIGAAANIKIALRSAKTGKDVAFIKRALCNCEILDNDLLITAALSGETELASYLTVAFFEAGAQQLLAGMVAFEKWCDEIIVQKLQSAKFTAFGLDPFVAYYMYKEIEIKNVRIILAGKLNNLSPDAIKTRVRNVYV